MTTLSSSTRSPPSSCRSATRESTNPSSASTWSGNPATAATGTPSPSSTSASTITASSTAQLDFLSGEFTFIGLGVKSDLEKLYSYGMKRRARAVVLGRLTVDAYGREELKTTPPKELEMPLRAANCRRQLRSSSLPICRRCSSKKKQSRLLLKL